MFAPPPASQHRLPTFSALDSLSQNPPQEALKTNHAGFDSLLDDGLLGGEILEICGPPGSGKSAMALQLAKDAIAQSSQVCWIDTTTCLPSSRASHVIETDDGLASICHFHAPTLAHLLALILYPPKSLIDRRPALLVVDNVSGPFMRQFPPGLDDFKGIKPGTANSQGKDNTSTKRNRCVGELAIGLRKLAGTYNIAIVVLNQLMTKTQDYGGPLLLVPSVAAPKWEIIFTHRLLFLRNDMHMEVENLSSNMLPRRLRYIKVLRANGVDHGDIQDTGLTGGGSGLIFSVNEQGIENIAFSAGAIMEFNEESDPGLARSVHSEEAEIPEELTILGVVPVISTSGEPPYNDAERSSLVSSPLEAYIVSQSDSDGIETPELADRADVEENSSTAMETNDTVVVAPDNPHTDDPLTSPLRKRKRSEVETLESAAVHKSNETMTLIAEKTEKQVDLEFKKPALPSAVKSSIATVQETIGMMSLPLHDSGFNFVSSIPSSTYMGTPIDLLVPQEEPLVASTIPDSDGEDEI